MVTHPNLNTPGLICIRGLQRCPNYGSSYNYDCLMRKSATDDAEDINDDDDDT